jgi:hypothetical protein
MAKSRITKRGKIRSMVKAFRPDGRLTWRKQKTLAMLSNKLQWARENYPDYTPEVEINSGISTIITESSSASNMIYIELE